MAAHNKPILTETPPDLSGLAWAPSFNPKEFARALGAHGYDVTLEKALMCPCKDKGSGNVRLTCRNCGGSGWIFINKTATRMLISHINQQTKFQSWTMENVGTVSVTTPAENRVGYMDRIVVQDVETVFTQICYAVVSSTGKLFSFLAYEPTEIEAVYLFDQDENPLIPLTPDQYTINGQVIQLDDVFLDALDGITDLHLQYLNLTVRYYHLPVYHIVDINREVTKNRFKDCSTGLKNLKELPISCMAKKPHVIFETPTFTGQGLYDNTVYP